MWAMGLCINNCFHNDQGVVIMPKKKAHAFNPMQIKDGWIVRLYKDGRIKSKIAPYEIKHKPVTKTI